jgi:hypothetical protein
VTFVIFLADTTIFIPWYSYNVAKTKLERGSPVFVLIFFIYLKYPGPENRMHTIKQITSFPLPIRLFADSLVAAVQNLCRTICRCMNPLDNAIVLYDSPLLLYLGVGGFSSAYQAEPLNVALRLRRFACWISSPRGELCWTHRLAIGAVEQANHIL